MDFANSPRTTATTAYPAVERSDIVARRASAPSELAPEKAVQPAGEAVRIDIDSRAREHENARRAAAAASAAADESVERKLVIDPRTRAIVLQKKDSQTGETIQQLPDETLLKLRAYSRELSERAREAEEAHHQVERSA